MIKKYLIPDYYFNDIYEITPDFLKSIGVSGLLCDIDNTLEPYEESVPTEKLLEWIGKLRKCGIQFAFISNNNSERVELFNADLGFFASAKSGKPFTKQLKKAIKHMDLSKESVAFLGDQVFTDVLAGKSLGLKTLLVKPIRDKLTLFFRFKRCLEKPILRMYYNSHNINDNNHRK